jgi:hypothetical protein
VVELARVIKRGGLTRGTQPGSLHPLPPCREGETHWPNVSRADGPTRRRARNEASSRGPHGFTFARKSFRSSSSRPRSEDSKHPSIELSVTTGSPTAFTFDKSQGFLTLPRQRGIWIAIVSPHETISPGCLSGPRSIHRTYLYCVAVCLCDQNHLAGAARFQCPTSS